MATNVRTRAGKAAALDSSDYDQNVESFSRTVDAKTANYTVIFSDQNKALEFTNAGA